MRAAVAVLNGPLGPTLKRRLLRDVGVDALRAAKLERAPAFLPAVPARPGSGSAPEPEPLLAAPVTSRGFRFEGVADFAAAYRAGQTTPLRVAERVLAAIADSERNAPPLRLFIAQNEEDLLRQAREASARFAAGSPRGALDGVPVAIKDELDVAGYPTTLGTRFLGTRPAEHDATVVARLRAAGALIIGKSNMHEIGIAPTGHNPHYGACRNPYHLEHDAGGSSSGVAAAVAAGVCPLAIGADGGGSIRIPAANCGLVGLKPTFGRVSSRGADTLCWTVGHIGLLAASAVDAAIGYAIVAGPDSADPNTERQPDVSLEGVLDSDLSGVRLGVPRGWFEDADPVVIGACRALVDACVARGAVRVPVEVPMLDLLQIAHLVTIVSELLASQLPHLAEHRKSLSADSQLALALGEALAGADYVQAQRARAEHHAIWDELFTRADVIVTPTSAVTAPRLRPKAMADGESDIELIDALMRFVRPGNFLGLPSIGLPAGYDPGGLPIGVMMTGRPWEEALLLRLARAAEPIVERRAPVFHRRLLD